MLPEPTIPQRWLFTFESQAAQFPRHGKPGLEVAREMAAEDIPVDCVTWRNRHGHVVGILYHYPTDSLLEKAGNVNVWVRSDSKHQGVGRRLIEAASEWWDINFEQQRYTPEGQAFAKALLKGEA